MTNATNKKNANAFYNVHLEGQGYLSNIETKHGKNGDFTVITVCLLEGKKGKDGAEKTFVNCIVAEQSCVDLLKQHETAINDRDVPVFATVRLAKFRAAPFVYGQNSANAGQLGVNYSGNMIKLMYLNVGDHEVLIDQPAKANSQRQQATAATQQSATQPATQADQGQQSSYQNSQEGQSDMGAQPQLKPLTVKVEKSDPNFESRKAQLKAEGYIWNKAETCWFLPVDKMQRPIRAELRQDDPQFAERKAQLKRDGYRFNSDECYWQLPMVMIGFKTPNRENYEEQLTSFGYVSRDDGNTWKFSFGQSQYAQQNVA